MESSLLSPDQLKALHSNYKICIILVLQETSVLCNHYIINASCQIVGLGTGTGHEVV